MDDQTAESRLATFSRYISASTPQALRRDAVNRLLRGPEGSAGANSFRVPGTPVTGDVVRLLPGNIGYIDLRVLQPHEVDTVFERVKSTAAIIFDMRAIPITRDRR